MKYEKDKTEIIKTRVNKTTYESIINYCDKLNICVAEFLREAITEQMKNEFI